MARKKTSSTKRQGILHGLRVVELGQRIAAPVAGMLLAEQGAEVVRIVDARLEVGDPVLEALLARGKTELPLELDTDEGRQQLRRLMLLADVVIENRQVGTLQRLGIDLAALRRENPSLITCSIPNFPEGDPRSELPDYESLVGTAGYLYHKPIGVPWVHDFPLGSVLAGLFATNAIAAALIARLRMGRGQHVSTSLFYSDLFAQVVLVLMKTGIPRGFLPLKMVGTPFMGSWLCGDDRYIYLHISLPAHNARIMEILEQNGYADDVRELRGLLSEETMRDPSQVKSIPEAKAIKVVYERVFLTRSAQEWEDLLGNELCVIKVRSIDEWLPDTVEAGMADSCTVQDPVLGELMGPGAAVTVAEYPPVLGARRQGAVSPRQLLDRWRRRKRVDYLANATERALPHPLHGVRVMDISRVIAGPCAARFMAELGAEVISLQRPTRLDWALSFHLLFNTGKKSITLDFTDEAGKEKLWAIMEEFQPHAFIQNYRHLELATEIGVHPEALRARFPKIAYTHLNAYGNKGIWRDRPGFEQVVQAVSGIQMTYGRGGKPKLLPSPVIDIGSGLLGAFATLMGLYRQFAAGESVFCTTHLTRMAVLFQVEPIARFQRQACLRRAREAGHPVRFQASRQVVGGILRGRDTFFCVAGPREDVEHWLRQSNLDKQAVAPDENPLDSVSRRVMLRSMRHWRQTLTDHGVADRVFIIPVPAMSKVVDAVAELDGTSSPPVRKRHFSGVESKLTFISNPIRMQSTPLAPVDPAPMRGEHTREILARIGVDVPEGHGVIPYPEAKPLLVWAGTLVRWGYFAWRSGNI